MSWKDKLTFSGGNDVISYKNSYIRNSSGFLLINYFYLYLYRASKIFGKDTGKNINLVDLWLNFTVKVNYKGHQNACHGRENWYIVEVMTFLDTKTLIHVIPPVFF